MYLRLCAAALSCLNAQQSSQTACGYIQQADDPLSGPIKTKPVSKSLPNQTCCYKHL